MAATTRITVIGPGQTIGGSLVIRLQSKGYQVSALSNLTATMGVIYSDPPDLVIVDLSEPVPEMFSIIKRIKEDCYFSAIPVIGLMGEPPDDSFDWETTALDDFATLPINYAELFCRISLSLCRIQRVFDNNPLTRLPGNTSIQQAIEKVLGLPMAVCYIDINNFKPYNDMYGFSRGDEVLRMIGRIMFNAVKNSGGGFTGHIGGDDFVFIVPLERAEAVCTTIIDHFTALVADIFDEREKKLGYYMATNRKGQEEKFPLLGIAIAVVPTNSPRMNHFGRVAQVAAELKKRAKMHGESCYVVDQRK